MSELKYFPSKKVLENQHFFPLLWRSRWKNIIVKWLCVQLDIERFKDHYFLKYTEMYLPVVLEKSFPWYPSLAPRPDHVICRSVI